MEKVYEREKTSFRNAQYAGRKSLEFNGFHPQLTVDEIEMNLLGVPNSIKEDEEPPFTASYIQAFHSIKSKNVTCKSVSRKRVRGNGILLVGRDIRIKT